jgi:hypothetical protein
MESALFWDFTHRNDVSEQPIGPIAKGQAFKEEFPEHFLDCLTLEDGTDRLFRNVGAELPFCAA